MGIGLRSGFSVAIVIASLALTGCQTSDLGELLLKGRTASDSESGGPPENRVSWALYTPFYNQGDHLHSLLTEDNNLDDAAQLYIEQKEYFSVKRDKHQETLELLARQLNEPKRTALEGAISGLNGIDWPEPLNDWFAVRKTILTAESTIEAYPSHEILENPDFRSPKVKRLEQTLAEVKDGLREDAPARFMEFEHFSPTPFFEVYPIKLNESSVMTTNFTAIEPKLARAGTGGLKTFAANYPEGLFKTEHWNRLGDMFIAASLREAGGQESADLNTILGVIKNAKKAGFEPKKVPGFKFAFVEVTSKTLLEHGQIDFPATVDVDIPVQAVKADLDEALTNPTAEGADFLIIFDVALAKASRRVLNLKQVPSVLLFGYKTVENPEYAVAQQNVEIAKINFNSAAIQASGYHGQGLAGAFSQLGASIGRSRARDKLNEAMQALANTPKTLQEPVYKKYNFDKAAIVARKIMTVHYYVIDQKKKVYFKSTFDVSEEENFNVAYRVDSEDTKEQEVLQEYDTEKEVDEFEKEASTVKLSQLINHYLGNEGQAKPLPSLAAIRQEMLTDKNKALASYRANTFDARPLNDPRFDSVVVVYRGDGALGSGFFVKPDIVLTNWHVVEEFKYVEMKMYDGQETFGRVLGKDVRLDLALVKVQSRGKPVRFYAKNTINPGSTVEAIGHPFKQEFSITRGIVSAIRNHFSINLPKGAGDDVLYIQTDAPINGGNSGGPLFLEDNVIGINTFGVNKDIAEGLNYSVHYSEVLNFLKEHLPGFQVLKN